MDPRTLLACRTLLDRERLRILGALATADVTTADLVARLALPPRVVSRHLARLEAAGMISDVAARGQQPEATWHLNVPRLAEIAADLASMETDPRVRGAVEPDAPGAAERDWSPEDARVLRAFFEGGRLTTIPAQHAKRDVVLRYLAATVFEPGENYPERDVNMRLALRHPDVAALRRYLVDEGYMARSAGIYRLTEREAIPVDRGDAPAAGP